MRHIILGGRANGLGIARELASDGCLPVALDFNPHAVAAGSRALAQFIRAPQSEEQLNQLIGSLVAQGGILYPTDDLWNAYIARNATFLRNAGGLFPYQSIAAIEVVSDKLGLYEKYGEVCNVPETRSFLGEEIPNGYIVKPRSPFTCYAVRKKGQTMEEIRKEYHLGGEYVVQRRIKAPIHHHYSVVGFRRDGQLLGVLLNAKILEYPHPGGTSTASVLLFENDVLEALIKRVTALLSDLSYEGVFEIEFVRDSDGGDYFMIDANLRFWLQHELGRLVGVRYALLYRDWLMGRDAEDPEVIARRVAWIHEGAGVSLLRYSSLVPHAIRALLFRRWLFAHARLGDMRPAWRLAFG